MNYVGGNVMVKASEIISNNIMNIMKQNGKKQIDLADYLGVSKQVISKMLTGGRMIMQLSYRRFQSFLALPWRIWLSVQRYFKKLMR